MIVARECGNDPSAFCRSQLTTEVTNTALYYEGQASASLGMLRTLVQADADVHRPEDAAAGQRRHDRQRQSWWQADLGGLGIQVGKEAAIANTAIYTLFVDASLHDDFAAETRTPIAPSPTARATPRCSPAGSSSSRARPAARSSPSRSAAPSRRSRGYRTSCRRPPARRRAGRRRSRRADATRNHGQDDPAQHHDSRPAVGDGTPLAARLRPRNRRRRRRSRPGGLRRPLRSR